MDPQLNLILPVPIMEEIINFSALVTKLTFRVTCKRFLPILTTTLCGSKCGHKNGNFIHAQFRHPSFGVLDSSANILYISEENHVIREIDFSINQVTTLCGTPERDGWKDEIGNKAQFHYPSGLALNKKENVLYVSDSNTHVIRMINLENGKVDTLVGNPRESGRRNGIGKIATFYFPNGLALDSIFNYLYVADSKNHCIRRILLNENKVETLCGKGYAGYMNGNFKEATFYYPWDIALNIETQELYVSDCYNHVIRVISLKSKTVNTLCGIPKIMSYENRFVTRIEEFLFPRGLSFDSHVQCLYVTDDSCTIKKISLLKEDKGKISILCGTANERGKKDGFFPTFNLPFGVIMDPHSHNLYVLDFGDNRVRKISNKKW